jgi:peptide subunit release factor 1 (eRF1)
VAEDEERTERGVIDQLASGVGAGGRGVQGVAETLQVLNERRVGALLLAPDFDRPGRRCPSCGMLLDGTAGRCPADGSQAEEVEHLREAVVQAAIIQDAQVVVLRHHPEEAPREGIGAVLRF